MGVTSKRAEEMKSLAAVVLSLLCLCSAEQKIYHVLLNTTLPYPLPDLPFGYDELEPFIDEATLRVHHTGHHKAYTTKMNSALEEWRNEVTMVTLCRAFL